MKTYTQEQLASRIANLRFDEALWKYWCAPDREPTLTTNDKKYAGYASVYNFLVECGEADTRRDNAIMRQLRGCGDLRGV